MIDSRPGDPVDLLAEHPEVAHRFHENDFTAAGRRYQAELKDPQRAEALAHLRGLAKGRQLTLLTRTREPEISQAAVLADLLRR